MIAAILRPQLCSINKIVLILLFISALSSFSFAQKLSLGIGTGFAQPLGEDAESGWLVSVEPGITLAKKIRLGLRYQFSHVARGLELPSNMNGPQYDRRSTNAFGVFAQYYFLDKNVRPFLGGGFGYYRIGGVYGVTTNGNKWEFIKAKSCYGGFINAGINYKKIFVTADYHIIPSTKENIDLTLQGPLTKVEVINEYISVGVGYIIGKI